MIRNITAILAALALCCATAQGGNLVSIELVTVGDPGNVADVTGYGGVPYVYSIGTYDITVGQYVTFLNAVATKSDPYGLYNTYMIPSGQQFHLPTIGISRRGSPGNFTYSVAGSYAQAANCPVTNVTWGDAARFVNWLQNGQSTGPEGPATTETGTYAHNGGTSNADLMVPTRSSLASWVLPSLDEWFKSAYYVGGGTNTGYWTYATQSNDDPSNVLSATGTNNANFAILSNQPPNYGATDYKNYLTPVGAFVDSPSAFGTYDQNGDVWQWCDTIVDGGARGLRGGSWAGGVGAFLHGTGDDVYPTAEGVTVGFRVAYVPEPSIATMLTAAAVIGVSFLKIRWSFEQRSTR